MAETNSTVQNFEDEMNSEEFDASVDDEEVDTEAIDEEIDDDGDNEGEEEEDDSNTLDALDENDPLEGPTKQFLQEILNNASLPINTVQVGLYLQVVTDDSSDEDDDLEELVTIEITAEQRLAILKANINQLITVLRTNSDEDFYEKVEQVRDKYADESGYVDINECVEDAEDKEHGDEDTLEDQEIDGSVYDYIDLVQNIVPGVKALYKEDPEGTLAVFADLIQWCVENNNEELYDDIARTGGKIMKRIIWIVLQNNINKSK